MRLTALPDALRELRHSATTARAAVEGIRARDLRANDEVAKALVGGNLRQAESELVRALDEVRRHIAAVEGEVSVGPMKAKVRVETREPGSDNDR